MITNLTFTQLRNKLKSGELSALEIIRAFKAEYEADLKTEIPLNGFLEFFDEAEENAKKADELIRSGVSFDEKPLLGLPVAIKDNISMKGKLCTCCSNALKNYYAPYNATVITRLLEAGAVLMGRVNMDELAMGSSTEFSCYGPTRNPVDKTRTPGGSSGGSAAVVAANQAPFSLGTETGGSVRLPASYCGIYGLKPTYGLFSRYGVTAFSSSLDQVGLFGKEASDIALGIAVMCGKDEMDETSEEADFSSLLNLTSYSKEEIAKMKFAVPSEFMHAEGLDPEVKNVFTEVCGWLSGLGAEIEEISIPVLDASIPTYYTLAISEAASNLSRIDGIRYGMREDAGQGNDELYIQTRSKGFGLEVKRRIITGNYVLSKEYSGDCYEKSLNVRAKIETVVNDVLDKYDFIICPTSPTPAFKLNEKVNDPIAMYLSDLFTTFVNLAHIPALSIPAGKNGSGLPIGIQFCGKRFSEDRILKLAKAWEER
ncbi:Asp-tRNA(Asn)/Glu-tRNA(Gln) amidotransferase subunit GatA [Treponema pedis]|uniref:Glutamyl-tRNA(Gln) amidotransferase subunit A n=1 Tax=Treponema pedis str. T A4 TaxID=1291379 RepID=S6A3M9_9SPIR|nr:Asp-tRNA(Asn)/Glu-tRNA(Gln) amidotransferase subunit GatA [Treponema pedis]AGT43711.1 aspartyl/glutamyl-tRNA amidotransferase subunit A [Treponema pedis str. T A4]